jgi:type IV secretory pathway TrbF-like protein
MKAPEIMPVPAAEYLQARREYLGELGSALVANNHLRVGLILLAFVALGLVFLNIRTAAILQNYKPLVVRIDEIGRAEAIKYGSLEYAPRDAEIRYFLIQFVTKHYSRRLVTVREDYATSLYYLDGRLANATIEANKKSKSIETFLAGEGEEIDVAVKNVSIEDLRTSPYKATVDLEKVYYTRNDHIESHRERYVVNLVFVVKERVPNSIVPVNPLGLTITYFREDQAFQ